jgi:phi13 family phage major tail protein
MKMANSRIGVENFTVAKMLTDVADGASTYDTPVAFTKKVMSIGISHASNMTPQYADDQVVDIYVDDGDITINISLTDITEDEKALLMGQTMSAGVRTPSPDDVHPYFAVSFKARKRNGSYKYYKLLKVMFKEPDEELSSKQAAVAPQTDTLSGTGIQRLSDGLRKRVADEDAATWLAATGTGWFTTGDISPDTTPPTVGVTPIDTATEQLVTVNVVWTFDEAILASQVTDDPDETNQYFTLMKADGTIVDGALSIGTNDTVVTFNPTESLAAGSDYISFCKGVKDKSGNVLAAPCVANFSTAS